MSVTAVDRAVLSNEREREIKMTTGRKSARRTPGFRAMVVGCLIPVAVSVLPASAQVFPSSATRVRSEAALLGAEQLWELKDPVLRIGEVEASGETPLFRVIGAHRFDSGLIAVANGGNNEVLFFDSRGELRSRVGGRGSGPGEFVHLSAFGPFPGDSVFIWDYPTGRVSLFSEDGGLGRLIDLRDVAPADYGPHGALKDGSLLLASGRAMVGGGDLPSDSTLLLLVHPPSPLIDTLGAFPKSDLGQPAGTKVFGAPVVLGSRGRMIVWGRGDRFELLIIREPERRALLVDKVHTPTPVTDKDWDRYKAYYVSNLRGQASRLPGLRQQAQEALEGSVHASQLPAFRSVVLSADDLIWVGEYRFPWIKDRRWHVFDSMGRWLTWIDIPSGFRLLDAGPNWVLGLVRGIFDEEIIELRPLSKGVLR
jgi:hypothetical protein